MAVSAQLSTDITSGVATTTDGTTSVLLYSTTAFLANDGGQMISFDLVGMDFDNDEVASAKIVVKLKNVSGTTTMVGSPVHLIPFAVGSSPGLQTSSSIITVVGNNINVYVIGVVDRTITWTCNRFPALSVLDPWTPAPTPEDGYFQVWSATRSRWEAVAIAGDLSPAMPTPTVSKIRNFPVSSSTPTNGQTFQVVGGSWTPTTYGGDVTGTPSASTVAKLQGRNVSSTAPTDQYALCWNAGANQWEPTTFPGGPPTGSAGGDLSSTYPNPTVINVTGAQLTSNYPPGYGGDYKFALVGSAAKTVGGLILRPNSTSGQSNDLSIIGQYNDSATNLDGGSIHIIGGYAGNSSKKGGNVTISSGDADTSRTTDFVKIISKAATGTSGNLWLQTNELTIDVPTATSATSGSNGAVPGQVVGYLKFTLTPGGTVYKIPYFNS